jgi:hypothetical protein
MAAAAAHCCCRTWPTGAGCEIPGLSCCMPCASRCHARVVTILLAFNVLLRHRLHPHSNMPHFPLLLPSTAWIRISHTCSANAHIGESWRVGVKPLRSGGQDQQQQQQSGDASRGWDKVLQQIRGSRRGSLVPARLQVRGGDL